MWYFYTAITIVWVGLWAVSLYEGNIDRGLLYFIILSLTQILANQDRMK